MGSKGIKNTYMVDKGTDIKGDMRENAKGINE